MHWNIVILHSLPSHSPQQFTNTVSTVYSDIVHILHQDCLHKVSSWKIEPLLFKETNRQ